MVDKKETELQKTDEVKEVENTTELSDEEIEKVDGGSLIRYFLGRPTNGK